MERKKCITCRRPTNSKYTSCSYCYSKNAKLKVLDMTKNRYSCKAKDWKKTWKKVPEVNDVGYEVC